MKNIIWLNAKLFNIYIDYFEIDALKHIKHYLIISHCIMSVTLHCEVGDIKIELYCEQCPKTCENFLALCASDYYNGCLFHRNIKGFMVQTGDPTGTGKGGQSIWGGKVKLLIL